MPYVPRLKSIYRSGKVDFWYSEPDDPETRANLCLGIVRHSGRLGRPDVRANRTPYTTDPIQFLLSRLQARYPDLELRRRPDGRFEYEPLPRHQVDDGPDGNGCDE